MNNKNYFVKLLMTSTNEGGFLLLYGFCSPTEQEPYEWGQHIVKRAQYCIWKAILTEEECNSFLDSLTRTNTICLGEKSFVSPQLFKRAEVLFKGGLKEERGPIGEYSKLTEFWNINKNDLYHSVMQNIGTGGKELYQDIRELLDWMLKECGIEFRREGYRFGNFECYHHKMNEADFEIEVHRDCGLMKTTVTKAKGFNNNLIVNCISEHRGRTICNQTKIFLPGSHILEFNAQEPMSKVVVQIWDEESSELIYSYNGTLCMEISMNMNLGGPSYQVRDPWSHKLFEAASNRSEYIKKHIESVSHTRLFDTVNVKSEFVNEIDTALEEGSRLFSALPRVETRGAFIENVQKDGEIQSFIKILEYIEQPMVKHVIIADPFFSKEAASKILCRISRSDIQLEIVTSLSDKDPDTEDVIADNGADRELRDFLETKAPLLHPNLLVCNLIRGGRQVFHDRYMIRYFEDGRIDGFLLSNSLNSMGQFYPFVVAPMEYEVCLEVSSYLESMRDSDIQSKVNKKERITCEILYDSKKKRQDCHQQAIPEVLFSEKWLKRWCDSDNRLLIPEQDIDAAVTLVKDHWNEDDSLACRTLCSVFSSVVPGSSSRIIDSIRNTFETGDLFIDVFIPLAREREVARNHMRRGIQSHEYTLWMLLNGSAQPSRGGFSKITEQAGHIWYDTDGWLHSGYILLYGLSLERYMELMNNTKSPMMFDIMVHQFLFYSWTPEEFCMVVETGGLLAQLVCADCVFEKLKMGWLPIEKCKAVLMQLPLEKRVVLMVRLLSVITFDIRVRTYGTQAEKQGEWRALSEWLMSLIATDIENCSQETQDVAIYWLHDCEAISRCKLHLGLAERITDCSVKNKVLDEAINIAQSEILDCSYDREIQEIVSLFLKGIDTRYGQDAEKEMFKKVIDWSVFETAAEPELRYYAHDRWYKASIGAKRQLQILQSYLEGHPGMEKSEKCMEKWKNRINCGEVL